MGNPLDGIVDITISRQTASIQTANFGTFGIISEFNTDKTSTTFDRYRTYASLTEMVADGWATTDPVYLAAAAVFSQNPAVDEVFVGRKDSGDADWTAALTAIQIASGEWYAFIILGEQTAKVVFDADFVASNSIVFTINGEAVTAVPFNADQATTMGDLDTQIEADIDDAVVTIDAGDTNTRTLDISIPGTGVQSCSVAITGGASQPDETVTFQGLISEANEKLAAAWAETQVKIFFYFSTDTDTYNPAVTDDIFSYMQDQNYDRSVGVFYLDPTTNADDAESGEYIHAAWPGEALPYDAGSQTWKFKTLTGVPSYSLTSAQEDAIHDKNGNIYTPVAGVSITSNGTVASGEYIDVIRGIDWIVAAMQETIFGELVNLRKIPLNDGGIQVITGLVRGVLVDAADQEIIDVDSIVVTAPDAADISTADKAARTLPDVTFTATLSGAIHKVEINGTLTL
jgi:hypothetical protein